MLTHSGKECDGLGQFQKLVGFVPQEDVMIRELSVRDNIEFSARYRLPKELTAEEINRKVNVCINELGIPHVQHSPIGDERTRGVSGGQRKRVNIGIELVADPKVLFLDEPTSGLDSTTATSLCSTLKKIANIRQMTIAAVIHQPSLSSFLEFDDLLLLGTYIPSHSSCFIADSFIHPFDHIRQRRSCYIPRSCQGVRSVLQINWLSITSAVQPC